MSGDSKESMPLTRPSIARRFGGYFLGRLNAPLTLSDEETRDRAVERENRSIDESQKAHFDANILHPPELFDSRSIRRLNAIKSAFETDLSETNTISERFDLFTEPFYAPYVRSLDLGQTKNPGSHSEVAALKEEYRELLAALSEKDAVKGELPRAKAKPRIHLSLGVRDEYIAATRNRDLFSYEEDARTIYVAKRMVFLMPRTIVDELDVTRDGSLALNEIKKIEGWLDDQNPETIVPVRTVYYVRSKLKKKEE